MSRHSAVQRWLSNPGDEEADAERRSVSFLGIHKVMPRNAPTSAPYSKTRTADGEASSSSTSDSDDYGGGDGEGGGGSRQPSSSSRRHQRNEHRRQQDKRQHSQSLKECFVLLPREGVVNVPYADASLSNIRAQLELQTGYAVLATRLLLRGREIDLGQTGQALPLATETLQLSVRPEFQELLDCVEAAACRADPAAEESVRAWLAAAKVRQLRHQLGSASRASSARLSLQQQFQGQHAGEGQADAEAEVTVLAHSAFVLACCRNRLELVKTFLQTMPNLANFSTRCTGRTALHFACYHDQPRLCRLLLARMRRACVLQRDTAGHRPVDYARDGADSPCRRLVLGETSRSPAQPIGAADRGGGPRSLHPTVTAAAAAAAAAMTSSSAASTSSSAWDAEGSVATMRLFQLPLPGKERLSLL